MNEVKYEYTAGEGRKARNPISRRSPDEIPGECGSLPVERGIVNDVYLQMSRLIRNVPIVN